MSAWDWFALLVAGSFLACIALICIVTLIRDEPKIAAWLGVCAGVAWLVAR